MNLFEKLLQIADALEREKVEYILIGGFAVILYGLPRLTQDLDLFINNTTDNVQSLRTALNQVFQDQSIEEITVEELDRYPSFATHHQMDLLLTLWLRSEKCLLLQIYPMKSLLLKVILLRWQRRNVC